MTKADALELGDDEGMKKRSIPVSVMNRGLSIVDFIFRLVAIMGTLGSSIAMATTNETLPFVTRFVRFRAEYDDFPMFTFFVVSNSIVCAYVVLSLPVSIFHILRSTAQAGRSRVLLLFSDTVMVALLTAGASAAASIVYLAHKGNTKANWLSICQQFNSFCERISGSLIGSFGGVAVFILLIVLSDVVLSRR